MNIIDKIRRARGRRRIDHPYGVAHIRLMEIGRAYERWDKKDLELLKYFPIALCACMETFFQLGVKYLIDNNNIFLQNAEKLWEGKQSFDLLKALHGKEITIGEIIAT